MLDSGASMHFTNDMNDYVEYQPIPPISVKTAINSVSVKGKGTVTLGTEKGEFIRIYPVYYLEGLSNCLLSLETFLQNGLYSRGSSHSISLYDNGNEKFLSFHPRAVGDTIFTMKTPAIEFSAHTIASVYSLDYETLHRRLAHPSREVLQRAGKYVKDFPLVEFPKKTEICPGCEEGKMTNKPFPPAESRAEKLFELIHSDLKSFPIKSYRKYKYAIVFYDDCSSHAWTMNLRTKDAVINATKQFIAMVENKYNVKIKRWMSDAGGEYKSNAFIKMLKDKGIEILQSVPHAHQQNGRAERIIRTLMEKVQAMRLQACLPQSWWEFALDHATHIYNRTPITCLAWKTPYEVLNNEKPTVDHLRVLGSGAYVFLPAEIRTDKLTPRSELMTYLGNAPGIKGWLFMHGPNNILFTATQATFNKTFFPRCPKAVRRPTTRL